MTSIITINYDSDRPTISGRALHEALEVNTKYADWFKRMCGYGFTENEDFVSCFSNLGSEKHGGQNKVDHQLTLDMAKELCMLQRTDKGKQFRLYFLEVEKQWNSPEAVISRALQMANRKLEAVRAENIKLLSAVEEQKPKVLFADAVSSSRNSILIGELAKLLKQNGFATGQNRLFEQLRSDGYLISRRGTDYNMPSQRSMEMGLFTIKEGTIVHADGHVSVSKTPKVTGKGQIYFINHYCGKRQ